MHAPVNVGSTGVRQCHGYIICCGVSVSNSDDEQDMYEEFVRTSFQSRFTFYPIPNGNTFCILQNDNTFCPLPIVNTLSPLQNGSTFSNPRLVTHYAPSLARQVNDNGRVKSRRLMRCYFRRGRILTLYDK